MHWQNITSSRSIKGSASFDRFVDGSQLGIHQKPFHNPHRTTTSLPISPVDEVAKRPLECFGAPDATEHLFILLFFFQSAFFLWSKQGLFLMFSFAFISFSAIAHICFSFFRLGNNNDYTFYIERQTQIPTYHLQHIAPAPWATCYQVPVCLSLPTWEIRVRRQHATIYLDVRDINTKPSLRPGTALYAARRPPACPVALPGAVCGRAIPDHPRPPTMLAGRSRNSRLDGGEGVLSHEFADGTWGKPWGFDCPGACVNIDIIFSYVAEGQGLTFRSPGKFLRQANGRQLRLANYPAICYKLGGFSGGGRFCSSAVSRIRIPR